MWAVVEIAPVAFCGAVRSAFKIYRTASWTTLHVKQQYFSVPGLGEWVDMISCDLGPRLVRRQELTWIAVVHKDEALFDDSF
ncbi:hypothetical protein HID58_083943 [Brassica napus]|uniref:Uncharacterized protein n=1 Tax=Brassica napus TaxID=3708 RepID=A0ABQ7XED3_BRANA|nr:hypothetical protein HID58_083943 [Brassica napus]